MTITASDAQRGILARVGDVDPATGEPPTGGGIGVVELQLPLLWRLFADKAFIAPRLQELYTERAALDTVLAVVQDEVNFTIGQGADQQSLSDRAKVLLQRRANVQTEIERVELRARAGRGVAVGQLTTLAPISPPLPTDTSLQIDANDPRYWGDPYSTRVVRP